MKGTMQKKEIDTVPDLTLESLIRHAPHIFEGLFDKYDKLLLKSQNMVI